MKYFDLKMFNSRKQNFKYELKKIENMLNKITLSHLEKNNKNNS